MATEIRKVLNLSLGESPKNLRELKQDITEIKTAIGDMVVAGQTGTTAFDQATKLLAQDMGVLRQTQNATKSEVAALDGSYNALVQRMRELKTEWRATNDEARRGELTTQITAINDQLKSLDYSLGNYQRNVGNYGNALQSLGQSVNTVQQAGSQFTNGLVAMAGVMDLTDSESKSLNSTLGVMQKTFSIMNTARGLLGLINAFKAKTAAMKAAKAETVAQTVATRAQTVATQQQAVATAQAEVAQKALNTTMKANPIGAVVAVVLALVTALGALAAAIFKSHSRMKQYESQVNSLQKAEERLNEKIEESNRHYSNKEKIWRALGIEGKRLIELQREELKTQLAMAKAHLATAEAAEAEFLAELKLETRSGLWIATHKGMIEQMKAFEEKTDAARKSVEGLEESLRDLSYDSWAQDIKDRNAAADAAAAAAEKEKDAKVKTAEEGQKLITEIEKAGLKEREKARQEYQENLHKLVLGRDAEADIAKAAGLPTKDIFDKYNKAAIQLYDQYLKSLQGIYSQEFKEFSDNEKKKTDLYKDTFSFATNGYKRAIVAMGLDSSGLIGKMFDATELDYAMESLKSLKNGIANFISSFKDINGNSMGLPGWDIDMYLKNFTESPEIFKQNFGEPLYTAISEYFEEAKKVTETQYARYANYVESTTANIEQLIAAGSITTAKSVIENLTKGMEEQALKITGDKNIAAIAKNYAKELKAGFYLEMSQDEWSSYEDRSGFLAGWYSIMQEITGPEGMERVTKQYKQMLAEMKAENLDKILIKPLDSVANMLGNVAQAWENTIRAQVDAGKKSEEEGKRAFERMKILQYGVAVISTASAVIQALADPTVPSYILKAVNAAAALAAGVAQVAQISATHYGSTGSNSTSTPQLVDRTPVQQTVSLNAAEAGQGVAQNMRVYVVESDITEAQNRTRARVSESTF